MTEVFFSVVIPTRDRCELVQDALRGLAQQTLDFELFEVVVVDNGSSDATIEVLEDAANRFPFQFRILRSPVDDQGPAPARNHGVRESRGEVIAFLDSDCRPAPDWLHEAYRVFAETPDLDFASGVIDFKPEQLNQAGFFSRKTVISLREHPTYPTSNSFYRRRVFLDHGGFDESLSFPNIFGQAVEAADTDLAWRVREGGGVRRFIDTAIVYHEVQVLPVAEWITEPLRLFLLPALISRHPALRSELLIWNLFFYRRSIVYYAALIAAVALLVLDPALLLGGAALLWAVLALARAKSVNPLRIAKAAWEIVLFAVRGYLMCAALVYGSILYRRLVL